MLDKLLGFFKDEFSLAHFESMLGSLMTLLEHFEENNLKDKNSFNAAVDTLCELLQNQKKK